MIDHDHVFLFAQAKLLFMFWLDMEQAFRIIYAFTIIISSDGSISLHMLFCLALAKVHIPIIYILNYYIYNINKMYALNNAPLTNSRL